MWHVLAIDGLFSPGETLLHHLAHVRYVMPFKNVADPVEKSLRSITPSNVEICTCKMPCFFLNPFRLHLLN